MSTGKSGRIAGLLVSLGLIVLALFAVFERNAIYDWFRLRNYQPSSQIVQLATNDTMTSYATHMFYVNHPAIQAKDDFNSSCPNNGGEQTIILGCYHPHETGIYVYSVTDPQLNGVEQVTAAHETLHAAYERLSLKDRNYVNGLLEDFYEHDLHDKRILDTIAAYKKSEPGDVVNEMHSVFGTEVANLPPALEAYYQRYFADRNQIVVYASSYQGTFTNNQAQAERLRSQINIIEQRASALSQQIATMEADLKSRSQSLDSERNTTTDVQSYNAQVIAFNAELARYRSLIDTYNGLVVQDKQLIAQYNAIVVETNQLLQELNSRSAAVSAQ